MSKFIHHSNYMKDLFPGEAHLLGSRNQRHPRFSRMSRTFFYQLVLLAMVVYFWSRTVQ